MTPTLGLLEAFDRGGALLARVPVLRWPVVVGRGLDCDLVLDDPYVAPVHLRMDRPAGTQGLVSVDVMDTLNGAALQRRRYSRGDRFDWQGEVAIEIGRTRVSLRLADVSVAQELPLPRFPWRIVALTAVLLLLVLATSLGLAWLNASDLSKYLKAVPGTLLGVVTALGVWCGLWAVANKVFAGRLQFWCHVRIASVLYVAVEAIGGVSNLLAFSFSWESFARFDYLAFLVATAGGIYAHLAAVLPKRRTGLAWAVAAAVILGAPAWLGSQWLENMRLSSNLYMSSVFPPNLRVADAVPVSQFLQEAQSLRERLDRRLDDDDYSDDDTQDAED